MKRIIKYDDTDKNSKNSIHKDYLYILQCDKKIGNTYSLFLIWLMVQS